MAELVMELAGVDKETAEKSLAEHKEVWLAVDSLLVKPVVSGEKYIPAKPVVVSKLSEEQEALCKRGRWLQDQVNAVFSVAHAQIRQDVPQEAESVEVPLLDESAAVPPPPSSSPQLDSLEQTIPEDLQSEASLQTHS
jgi:hypothetical protein